MSGTLEELVERQVRRARAQGSVAARVAQRPCIALSRLPGTPAPALGQAIAKRIGFDFLGIEIIDAIARDQGLERRLVESLDEHVRSAVDRYVLDTFRVGTFSEADYLRSLLRILRGIGENGSAVVLGRGATCIFPSDRALRVLVVAPRQARIEHLAGERKLTHEQATQLMAREEQGRREFYRYYFDNDPDDTSLYDLAVNTETLGVDAAAEMVVLGYRARFGSGS